MKRLIVHGAACEHSAVAWDDQTLPALTLWRWNALFAGWAFR
jgi:hypothetical protein